MMKRKFIAPDGGWGWVIALAFALNNIVTIPIIQGFGMIYGGAFQRLGITATQSTIIININQAFGMILGMMNGPLLRRYGYRKVAVTGTLIFSMGVILTSFARSFVHFVITYGMLTSIGINMATSSNMFALNTYFKEKRGRAIGMTMTITGLGPIFLPQLISILLFNYGSEGTMLILGSISLNALVAALFLQPIKWHAKPEKMIQENFEQSEDDLKNESTNLKAQESFSLLENLNEKNRNDSEGESKKRTRKLSRTVTMASDMSDDNISVYGFEMPVSFQNGSILDLRIDDDLKNEDSKGFQRKLSSGNFEPSEYKRSNSFNDAKSRKFSVSSMKYGDLELSKNIITEFLEEDEDDSKISREFDVTDKPPIEEKYPELENPTGSTVSLKVKKRKPLIIRIFRRIAKLFDLDLLRDPTYVNIMLGMSFAIFAEFNFSVLTPFILRDMNFNTDGIAMLMSTLATSDLLLRALAPYIGEWLRKSPRVMYLFSLFLLILTRTALLFARHSYSYMLIVAFGLGIAKGLRTVYMTLVIPSHVPLERLPAASSIQSLTNGFIMLVAGPFLGVIKDLTGSYAFCIALINFVTAITIIMWSSEFIIKRVRRHRKLKFSINLEQNVKKVESR